MNNILHQLTEAGVSIWLDDLNRNRIHSGNLQDLIDNYYVRGVTTNPSIFSSAIGTGSAFYSEQIADCAAQGLNAEQTIRLLTTDDVRAACDVFEPIYQQTLGVDGRVSIEVDPRLARDTAGTIESARDLWQLVDRPNLFIKIPATREGLPAITQVISEGMSVNVTLIFSVERYAEVIDAYLSGLELANANGHDLSAIQSVASFFISRVDTSVDSLLRAQGSERSLAIQGQTAVANARLAWQTYVESIESQRWKDLQGAQRQRPLWASTGVKDPAYPDTRYVLDLVAPGCVNTMPEKTLMAVADHGVFMGDTMSGMASSSTNIVAELSELGIDLPSILVDLETDGVEKFAQSWNELISTVDTALRTTLS